MKKRILVIEDNRLIRASITDLLEAEDYQVYEAENGTTAIEIADDEQPNLILCDVSLPGLNGFDVLRTLRHSPKTEAIPFVFVSGLVTKEDIALGILLGANGYLTKPFTLKELLGTVTTNIMV